MCEKNVDIISIDLEIKNMLSSKESTISDYYTYLDEINITMKNKYLQTKTRNLLEQSKTETECYIDNMEKNSELNFYIIESFSIIDEYIKILRQPVKMSFTGRRIKKNNGKTKLINEYLDIASSYIDIGKYKIEPENIKMVCDNCQNKKYFETLSEESINICSVCNAQKPTIRDKSSYNDIDRVNMSTKYMYARKTHFKDCMKQYQGKQQTNIPDEVYDDLKNQFVLHHLDDKNDPDNKFKDISKNVILIFLKDLGYTKHYDNVHLIHSVIAKKKPVDITHLEDKLLNDFDILSSLYDKVFKDINRKNFINTQYVLYQLLMRHKFPCIKEEFSILKTVDRKSFHDDICKTLFEKLGWNHTPFY